MDLGIVGMDLSQLYVVGYAHKRPSAFLHVERLASFVARSSCSTRLNNCENSEMSNNTNTNTIKINFQQHPFHLVKPSPWPFLLAFSLCLCLIFTVL